MAIDQTRIEYINIKTGNSRSFLASFVSKNSQKILSNGYIPSQEYNAKPQEEVVKSISEPKPQNDVKAPITPETQTTEDVKPPAKTHEADGKAYESLDWRALVKLIESTDDTALLTQIADAENIREKPRNTILKALNK